MRKSTKRQIIEQRMTDLFPRLSLHRERGAWWVKKSITAKTKLPYRRFDTLDGVSRFIDQESRWLDVSRAVHS